MEFTAFPKLHRLHGPVIVTEKIDGTNAQIKITEDGGFYVASRTRWITQNNDNHGFATWAYANKTDLMELLGVGTHFGEWMGKGIQRGYGLDHKRFYLFNTTRWVNPELLAIFKTLNIYVVPVLYNGVWDTVAFSIPYLQLKYDGSVAVPGYKNAEGIVIYDTRANVGYKKTFEYDEKGKGLPRDEDGNVKIQEMTI